jgi:hypothetical protein
MRATEDGGAAEGGGATWGHVDDERLCKSQTLLLSTGGDGPPPRVRHPLNPMAFSQARERPSPGLRPPSPRSRGASNSHERRGLLPFSPHCGEKVAGGRMRGSNSLT